LGQLTRIVLPLLLLLPAGGCCWLADWMDCYPDTPLVTQGWRTPGETLGTFQAAVLHGDVEVIYLCLSQGFKRRLGLDSLTAHLAWPRLREQNPFLRSLFRAEVTARSTLPDGRRALVLEAMGHRFQVVLKGEPCVKVLTLSEDGEGRMVVRRILDDDLAGGLAGTLRFDRRGVIGCLLDRPEWREDLAELEDPGRVTLFQAGIEWKIDDLSALEE